MKYDPAASIKIPIRHLTVGMFVTAIEDNRRVNLANAGRVASLWSVTQLMNRGIKYAWVDRALSAKGCVFPTPAQRVAQPVASREPIAEEPAPIELNSSLAEPASSPLAGNDDLARASTKRSFSRDSHQKRAHKILVEARTLVKNLLSQTFDGTAVAIDEINLWAEELLESVLIDSDALQCVSALRHKDSYLLEHSVNVACLLVAFGQYLGLDKPTLKALAVGGVIHDIGKTRVGSAILRKTSKLTPAEFEQMKQHQWHAQQILKSIHGLSPISRDVCLMHHEKLDGSGYPAGLRADQIPLHGRMSAIIDIYDALTSDRSYKRAMSSVEAFKVLLGLTPKHLDRELVYKFINCLGIYPVGSVVELSDQRLGIVWVSNAKDPLKPEVKCFYSTKYTRFTEVNYVDLNKVPLTIGKAVSPASLDIDMTPFFIA